MSLFNLFLNNLSPVLLIAGSGYLLGRRFQINPRTFSQVVFYFFSPCLVFNSLAKNQLSESDFLSVAGFALIVVCVIGLLAWSIGSTLRLERHLLAAVMITSMFDNAGNLGLSVTFFAFGDPALARATVKFVIYGTLTNTVGAVIASLGKSGLRQASILEASMPTAVMCTILATEFDVEPAFVTSVVFLTTILSPLTITPLLSYLGG